MTAVLQRNNYHFIHKKPQIHVSGHGFSVKDGPTNQHRGHRHPEFSDFTARVSTFWKWTYETVQSSDVLARNGFFYTGEVDKVRCYSCNIGFKDFHSTDDIFIEHLRHSPSCRYLAQLLDERPSGENIVEKGRETDIRKYDLTPVAGHHGTNQQSVPVSPEFESYTARLASYRAWPAGKTQTPEQLAAAGFYFTGCGDIVRCHCCDGGLNNWDPLDDPWIEHARHFQRCSFLRRVKGEEYIRLVHNYYETLLKPKHLPQSRVSLVGYKNARVQEKGSHLSPKTQQIKEQLLEMGFTNEDIDKAVLICKREKADTTLDKVLNEIDKLKKLDETQVIVTKDRVNMQDIPPVKGNHGAIQHSVPVSPEFESYTVRLQSYRGWPAGKTQTPEQLAAAGFYFTGCDDIVRCYCCDGGLNNWDPLDDPWIEHARHFHRCSFLRRVKGEEYIRLVHHHYETLLKPKHLPQSRVSIAGYKDARVQVKGSHMSPKTQYIKEQLLEMGFTNKDIDKALLICIREKADTTLDKVLDELDKLKKLDETQVIVTKDRVNMQDQIDEYRRLKYELNCKLCQQIPSNTLFLPCQHHCCCSGCSDVASICPLCGENVQLKIRTYS